MALKVYELELPDGQVVRVRQGTWTPGYAHLLVVLRAATGPVEGQPDDATFYGAVMGALAECLRPQYEEREVHRILGCIPPDDAALMARIVGMVRGRQF